MRNNLQAEAALPLVVVDDTRLALGTLAAACARFAVPLIGVTGSKRQDHREGNAPSCAQAQREGSGEEAVLATQGNLNNDIGLPLTLLS